MRSKLKAKSSREKLLIKLLVLTMVVGGYLVLRIKPLNTELNNLQEQVEQTKKERRELRQEVSDVRQSSRVKEDINKWQQKLETERKQLEGLNISFINLNQNEALFDMLASITEVARRNNLQIISKKNEPIQLAKLVGKDLGKHQEQLRRQMFNLQLRGTFESMYKFIDSLDELENSVLITRLSLKASNDQVYNSRRLISANLTLAI